MNNDLLPFPEDISEKENNLKNSFLPGFPQESSEPLNSEELVIVRKMIADYKSKMPVSQKEEMPIMPTSVKSSLFTEETVPVSSLFCDEPPQKTSVSAVAFMPDEVKVEAKDTSIIELLEKQKLGDPFEAEALKKMIDFAKSADNTSLEFIAVAILGLIPCKKFIRHGTPEQKLFILKSLGDRFLDGIAGLKWNDRRKLLKVVAGYLSALSENYSFIPMEGESFNPTLHERVLGASSGNLIKEMRGFLVVAKGTNRVTYAGVVLT